MLLQLNFLANQLPVPNYLALTSEICRQSSVLAIIQHIKQLQHADVHTCTVTHYLKFQSMEMVKQSGEYTSDRV